MNDLAQLNSGRLSELGVGADHFNSPSEFVNDTLTRPVTAAEQFEVLDSIISTDSVDVMDGLIREKRASEVFGHHESMFHDRVFFASNQTRDRYPNVSVALDMAPIISGIEFRECFSSLVRGFAFLTAIFLLGVQTASRFAAAVFRSAALNTNHLVAFFGRRTFSQSATRSGTVERIAPVLYAVRGHERFHHGERFAAHLAGKLCRGASISSGKAVIASTLETAKLAVAGARRASKRLVAIQTDFFDRHGWVPLCGNTGTLTLSVESVK